MNCFFSRHTKLIYMFKLFMLYLFEKLFHKSNILVGLFFNLPKSKRLFLLITRKRYQIISSPNGKILILIMILAQVDVSILYPWSQGVKKKVYFFFTNVNDDLQKSLSLFVWQCPPLWNFIYCFAIKLYR